MLAPRKLVLDGELLCGNLLGAADTKRADEKVRMVSLLVPSTVAIQYGTWLRYAGHPWSTKDTVYRCHFFVWYGAQL